MGVSSLMNPDRATIEALCMIAEDAAGSPELVAYIARVILERLTAAAPPWKLPAVYLLDAIGKNSVVGLDFQAAASPVLVEPMMVAFQQVRCGVAPRMSKTR